ncbi:MAG: response regulator [Desulfobacteraceae bacterium A6]|nr:MAG: response regulator [Desulfobacteraceae bacterium A6]
MSCFVDDEEEFVTTLSERIQMRNFVSSVAFTGEQALQIVEEQVPDVMILDLKMPGIDGMEVLRRMKKTSPKVKIIILTGHGSEKDKEEALSLGAFGYLQKPVQIDELERQIIKAHKAGTKKPDI